VEAGVRSRAGSAFDYEISGYSMKAKDEIGFDAATFSYGNIQESSHLGVEASATYRPWKRVTFEAGYTYTRARFDTDSGGGTEGNQINNVPEHVTRAGVTLAHGRISAGLTAADVRDQFADEGNQVEIPPYTLLDARLGIAISGNEIYAKAANVFDEAYSPAAFLGPDSQGNFVPLFYPGAGRQFDVGVRFSLD
jgi:outer membrane receptor protein involved in Fe transport